jgi:ankyrin repeat protein
MTYSTSATAAVKSNDFHVEQLPTTLFARVMDFVEKPHQLLGALAQCSRSCKAYADGDDLWTVAFRRRFNDIAPWISGIPVKAQFQMALVNLRGIDSDCDQTPLAHAILAGNAGVVRIYLSAGVNLAKLAERLTEILVDAGPQFYDTVNESPLSPLYWNDDTPDGEIRRLLLPRLPPDFSVHHEISGPDWGISAAPLATAAGGKSKAAREVFWEIYSKRLATYSEGAFDPRFMLERINIFGNEMLSFVHLATKMANLKLLQELVVHHKTDPRPVTHCLDTDTQRTPLYYAESNEIAQLLLGAGADVAAVDYAGCSPLMYMLGDDSYRIDTTVTLASHPGADLDVQDNRGWTALHWAARHGRLALVAILIRKGADTEIRDKRRRTPLQLAQSKRVDPSIAGLLSNTSSAWSDNYMERGADGSPSQKRAKLGTDTNP